MGYSTRIAALLIVLWPLTSAAQEQPAEREMQANRRPKSYLAIFLNGYAQDHLPEEDAQFEKLLGVIAREGHFNAILCRYTPQREALCRKQDVKMVVDLLSPPHVYQNPKECEELLKSLRNNPTIVAYHLWADRFGKTGPGRARDIDNVHQWDPTHATYSGTYKDESIAVLAKSDFVSYYDFSWKRGPHKNFPHLLAAWNAARTHDNRLGRYCETDAGLAGQGNPNRLLYIQTTSIACGLRAAMWHIGSRIMDMKSFELNQWGKDLATVNAYIKPMRAEIARIGLPTAIYSTPVTMDPNHRPVEPVGGKPAMPPGLEKNGFPKDFWIQPVSGEFVMGVSNYDATSRTVVFVANHDAYGEQSIVLKLPKETRPQLFNRARGDYEALEVRKPDNTISFKIEPAGGAIVLFD